MKTQLRPALVVFALLTLVTGVAYPLFIALTAQVIFPHQANGSLLRNSQGKAIGSELIAQPFDAPHYFWARPSATSPFSNNATASSGSNLGPTSPDLLKALGERIEAIRAAHPDQKGPAPADLVTTSASGLDPHISPAAAEYQANRVAAARNVKPEEMRKLIAAHTEARTLGVLGEPRVNVLTLNVELDRRFPMPVGQ